MESRERGSLNGEDRVRGDEHEVAVRSCTHENASADQLCLASVGKRRNKVHLTNFPRQRFQSIFPANELYLSNLDIRGVAVSVVPGARFAPRAPQSLASRYMTI